MGVPLGQWSASESTDKLRETIERLNAESERQTKIMVRLTWAIFILTGVMTIGVGVQIFISLHSAR